MIKQQYKYSDVTAIVLGCAFEVHKILGNGFQEVIYQRALEEEFNIRGISFSREFEMPIFLRQNK
jgi:GxxExxY protein